MIELVFFLRKLRVSLQQFWQPDDPPTFRDINDGALSSVGDLQGCEIFDAANIQVMDGKEVVDLVDEHSWVRVTTDAGKRLANCLPVFFHVSHFCICYETQTWMPRVTSSQDQ